MKRDVDLCRQLLFDLEAHGPDCAVNVLRTGIVGDADDRVRHHLRLLIDAGFVKEVDRTTNGLACVRLTNSGVELLEVCRCDRRWRDSKQVVLERTGGLSLTVLRAVLTKWAVEATSQVTAHLEPAPYRSVHPRRAYRPRYRRDESRSYYQPQRYDYVRSNRELTNRELLEVDDSLQLVRSTPDYREHMEYRQRYNDVDLSRSEYESLDGNVGVTMPIYLV